MKQFARIGMLLALAAIPALAQLRLPRIYGNGMVLQRDTRAQVHGWASPGALVALTFEDSTYSTRADSGGGWRVALSPRPAGGPTSMRIASGRDTLAIRDILFGDVWICSGQSNMELPMIRVRPIYASAIARSDNPLLRQFLAPQRYNFNAPEADFPAGTWKAANPENVLEFSAAAYFFASALYDRSHVPIGIINASLGGSPVESWMSEDALKGFPDAFEEARRFRDSTLIRTIEGSDRDRIDLWHALLNERDAGHGKTRGTWANPHTNIAGWGSMALPGYWMATRLGAVNGAVWFRKEFHVPGSLAGTPAMLVLGRIVDEDSVWINGRFIGNTTYQYPPRLYDLSPGVLVKGKNSIVIRVVNSAGRGGFVPDKPYEIQFPGARIDLKGAWRYRLGATIQPLASQTFIRWKPLGLFNGMIAPLLGVSIKGAIWYQGESNTKSPFAYRELFPSMIRDWRKNWNQGDFPFLFVQLPNFMDAKPVPSESNWAVLRESQLKSLAVPRTGMAVSIDIGEWNDIHPMNKRDVGARLALAAARVAYGDSAVVSSGPLYKSMRVEGDSLIIDFTSTGGGLSARGADTLRQFAVAGADGKFTWAHATIQGSSVVVRSGKVPHPAAVRYAWADNPEGANLTNREGLPASPFRTDDWPVP